MLSLIKFSTCPGVAYAKCHVPGSGHRNLAIKMRQHLDMIDWPLMKELSYKNIGMKCFTRRLEK